MENIKKALNNIDAFGEHIRTIGGLIADHIDRDDAQTTIPTLTDCIDMYVARLHSETESAYKGTQTPPPVRAA